MRAARTRSWRTASAALFCALSVRPVAAAPVPATMPGWPDDRFHRLAALALVEELRASLLSETSATLTLETWCRRHRIAVDPRIVAEPDPGADAPLDAGDRALLEVSPSEPVRFRHVRLLCGNIVLSDADNWYVPRRLTPEMNRVLDTTRTPFGKAIAALGFTRTTLWSRPLWSPLAPDWADTPLPGDQAPPAEAGHLAGSGHPSPLPIPATLLENRALLRDRDGRPLALLVERYRAGVLAFTPPSP